jgi:hypothetical protein
MGDRSSWHMARIASRRPLARDRKVPAPVGEPWSVSDGFAKDDPRHRDDPACEACGYHVCGCPPKRTLEVHTKVFRYWQDAPDEFACFASVVDGKELVRVECRSSTERPTVWFGDGVDKLSMMVPDALAWVRSLTKPKPRCVMCGSTGVHSCIGGTLSADYLEALALHNGSADQAFGLRSSRADIFPGLVDADAYPELPVWPAAQPEHPSPVSGSMVALMVAADGRR